MAPRDPILGLNEQFNADPNPAKVNLGVGVYFDDHGKLPVLACVAAAEQQLLASPKAKGYLPIDGIAAYDKAVQGLVFGAESAEVQERPRRHRADAGRHRRPEGGRRLPAQAAAGRPRADQRPELGEPPRPVQPGRLRGRHLPVLRRRHARHPLRRHARRAAGGRSRHRRRAARLLPQPHRLRPAAGAVGAGGRRLCAPARPGAVPGHGLPGLRRRHRRRRRRRAALPGHAESASSSPPRSPRAFRSTANASARSAWSAAAPRKRHACCRS